MLNLDLFIRLPRVQHVVGVHERLVGNEEKEETPQTLPGLGLSLVPMQKEVAHSKNGTMGIRIDLSCKSCSTTKRIF